MIDETDISILSNITTVKLRKSFSPTLGSSLKYSVNFSNALYNPHSGHNATDGGIVVSTGFKIDGDTTNVWYLDDDGDGNVRRYRLDGAVRTYGNSTQGTIDYDTGLIEVNSLNVSNIEAGDTELNTLDYNRIVRDFNNDGNSYHILHESTSASDGDYTNGFGIFILNPNPQIDNSFIHVNHPNNDFKTIYIAAKLFEEVGAKWLFVAGTDRYAAVDNSNYSSLSECTTQCGECSADMARTTCSVFQKFHEKLSNYSLARSISIWFFYRKFLFYYPV